MIASRTGIALLAAWAGLQSNPSFSQDIGGDLSEELTIASEEENEPSQFPDLELAIEMLDQLSARPCRLNEGEGQILADAGLISARQYYSLVDHGYRCGVIRSHYELLYLDGWDEQTVRKILPYTDLRSPAERFRLKESFRKSESELTMKASGVVNSTSTEVREDGVTLSSQHAGSPARIWLRYDYRAGSILHTGFRMEKDPGERIFQAYRGDRENLSLPDHCSGFLSVKGKGILKSLYLGDYLYNFGQGLVMARGISRNRLIQASSSLRAHTSLDEYRYFRGIALTTRLNKLEIDLFLSSRRLDPGEFNQDTVTGKIVSFSALSASGLHRTPQELQRKNRIREQIAGFGMRYSTRAVRTGVFGSAYRYSARLSGEGPPYRTITSASDLNSILGAELQLALRKTHIAFECSAINFGYPSWIVKGQFQPLAGLRSGVCIWHHPAGLHNPYGTGSGNSSRVSNDDGICLEASASLPERWQLSLRTELSRRPFASYSADAPSYRQLLTLRLEKPLGNIAGLVAFFSWTGQSVTISRPSEYMEQIMNTNRMGLRVQVTAVPLTGFESKTGMVMSFWQSDRSLLPAEQGAGLFQDFHWQARRIPLRVWARMAIFGTGSWNSRIYAYENGPLYDFSTKPLYGRGWRTALMCQCSPFRWIDLWLKAGMTQFFQRRTTGNVTETKDAGSQTTVEIQARLRW
jgi:hypothetical protein